MDLLLTGTNKRRPLTRYHAEKKLFATYDDLRSIRLKTQYAIGQGLNGTNVLGIDTGPTRGRIAG